MASDEIIGKTVAELQQELAEMENSEQYLRNDLRIYRRLGVSSERLNLRLRQLDARKNLCRQLIRQRQSERPAKTVEFSAIGTRHETSPTV